MKLTFTVGMATAAFALAVPGPIQRPGVPFKIGPITGTDEVAASSVAIPGPIQRPDIPVGVGPITGTDEVIPLVATRAIQPTNEDWYTALRDPAPTPVLTRRGCGRKHRQKGDIDEAWLDQLLDNVELDAEEEQADEDRRMKNMFVSQKPADQTMGEFSEDLKVDLRLYDDKMEAEMQEEETKEDNQAWHKRRGKILRRKRRITKIFDFIDRALTWIWAAKGEE